MLSGGFTLSGIGLEKAGMLIVYLYVLKVNFKVVTTGVAIFC